MQLRGSSLQFFHIERTVSTTTTSGTITSNTSTPSTLVLASPSPCCGSFTLRCACGMLALRCSFTLCCRSACSWRSSCGVVGSGVETVAAAVAATEADPGRTPASGPIAATLFSKAQARMAENSSKPSLVTRAFGVAVVALRAVTEQMLLNDGTPKRRRQLK